MIPRDVVRLTDGAFRPGGEVSRALADLGRPYAHSREQAEYAHAVAETFARGLSGDPGSRGGVSLMEAATGVGKTLGYLVPLCLAALLGRPDRAVVATFTTHLLRQIIDAEMPVAVEVARRLTGETVKAAPRYGVRNFVSSRRIAAILGAMEAEGAPAADLGEVGALLEWAEASSSHRVEGFALVQEWVEANGPLPAGLSSDDVCLCSGAEAGAEAYRRHLDAAREADVLVVTQAMLLLNNHRWFSVLDLPAGPEGHAGDRERRLSAVVVDEADRLETAAESIFSGQVSLARLEAAALQSISVAATVAKARKWFDAVHERCLAGAARNFRRNGVGGGMLTLDALAQDGLAEEAAVMAEGVAKRIESVLAQPRLDREIADEFGDLRRDLMGFVQACRAEAPLQQGRRRTVPLLRWSPVRAFPSFSTVPLSPGRLTSRLWNRPERGNHAPYAGAVVLTSATLGAPGKRDDGFRSFRGDVGIDDRHHTVNWDLCRRWEPEDFGRAEFVLADRRAPKPSLPRGEAEDDQGGCTDPAWIAYAASGIADARRRGGRTLVLATSYADASALSGALPADDGYGPLIVHERGRKLGEHLGAYLADPNATLITPVGWEGLDLPGAVDNLVVTRLPFAARDTAANDALMATLLDRGHAPEAVETKLFVIALDRARRKLRQGLGRGIRRAGDRVRIYILDPRFPLPDAISRDPRRGQANRSGGGFLGFMSCVPLRFRDGPFATMDDAEIWRIDVA